jgi:ParB family transcriptional regulator, chromosome partitioning protein
LIAGGHRLEAAIALGWTEVPAKVWHCSAQWARMMEVDDNLAHAELSTIELCGFLAERKRAFLGLKPHLKRGVAGAAARWEAASGTMPLASEASFAASVAAKRGLSKRHVYKLLAIGEALAPTQLQGLYGLEVTPSLAELMALSKLDAEARNAAIATIVSGTQASVKAALKAMKEGAEAQTATFDTSTETEARCLLMAWTRASKAAREQFLSVHRDSVQELLSAMAKSLS